MLLNSHYLHKGKKMAESQVKSSIVLAEKLSDIDDQIASLKKEALASDKGNMAANRRFRNISQDLKHLLTSLRADALAQRPSSKASK